MMTFMISWNSIRSQDMFDLINQFLREINYQFLHRSKNGRIKKMTLFWLMESIHEMWMALTRKIKLRRRRWWKRSKKKQLLRILVRFIYIWNNKHKDVIFPNSWLTFFQNFYTEILSRRLELKPLFGLFHIHSWKSTANVAANQIVCLVKISV